MDKQGKQVADLQVNVQNKTKKIEKQAKQIEDLKNELKHQREFSKDLSDRLSTKCACVAQRDERRLQRLYSEIVGNHDNPGNIGTQISAAPGGTQPSPATTFPGSHVSTAPGTQGPAAPGAQAPAAPGIKAPAVPDTRVPAAPRTQAPTALLTQVPDDISTQAPTAPRPQTPAATHTFSTHPPTVPPAKSAATQAPAAPRAPSPVAPGTGPTPTSATTQTRTIPVTRTRAISNTKTQVRIFSDSLWNDVDPTRMFIHKSASITKSSTLQKAKENATTFPDDSTELVIIHVGSNDMDNTKHQPDSVNICVEQTLKLIDCAKASYPTAKIAMSQVLPRGKNMLSNLNRNIAMYNNTIEKSCLEDSSLIYIRHRLLSEDRSLYKNDGIHLRPDAGIRLMVADAKRTMRHHRDSTRQPTEAARGPQWMPNPQLHMQPSQHPPPFWKTPRNPPHAYTS
ncbi:Hypp6157 [Branchiostoma lanceolatum]|uniref:Hypp6157 protein n=1 Tax=Branchiostoma lanceolatum TaxID=7740 RepID=A0A8J9YSR9_BRALA|nr:Hypp6157 [Branchiostoma lanceolatum]